MSSELHNLLQNVDLNAALALIQAIEPLSTSPISQDKRASLKALGAIDVVDTAGGGEQIVKDSTSTSGTVESPRSKPNRKSLRKRFSALLRPQRLGSFIVSNEESFDQPQASTSTSASGISHAESLKASAQTLSRLNDATHNFDERYAWLMHDDPPPNLLAVARWRSKVRMRLNRGHDVSKAGDYNVSPAEVLAYTDGGLEAQKMGHKPSTPISTSLKLSPKNSPHKSSDRLPPSPSVRSFVFPRDRDRRSVSPTSNSHRWNRLGLRMDRQDDKSERIEKSRSLSQRTYDSVQAMLEPPSDDKADPFIEDKEHYRDDFLALTRHARHTSLKSIKKFMRGMTPDTLISHVSPSVRSRSPYSEVTREVKAESVEWSGHLASKSEPNLRPNHVETAGAISECTQASIAVKMLLDKELTAAKYLYARELKIRREQLMILEEKYSKGRFGPSEQLQIRCKDIIEKLNHIVAEQGRVLEDVLDQEVEVNRLRHIFTSDDYFRLQKCREQYELVSLPLQQLLVRAMFASVSNALEWCLQPLFAIANIFAKLLRATGLLFLIKLWIGLCVAVVTWLYRKLTAGEWRVQRAPPHVGAVQ